MKQCSDLDISETFEYKPDSIASTASYSPSLENTERFVDLTLDKNPIHRKHPEYQLAIAPGFRSTAIAITLIREAMRQAGPEHNPIEFPYSVNEAEMKFPVLTGRQYQFRAEYRLQDKSGSAALTDESGKEVFKFTRMHCVARPACLEEKAEPEADYCFLFREQANLNEFGSLVGSTSAEPNLYALAASSSIVAKAIGAGVLSMDPNTVALYAGTQRLLIDSSSSANVNQEGFLLELFVDAARFGKRSGQEKPLEMRIVGTGSSRLLYVSEAPLSFQDSRLVDMILKKASRQRK